MSRINYNNFLSRVHVNADILCLEELPKGVKQIEEEPSREEILFPQESL